MLTHPPCLAWLLAGTCSIRQELFWGRGSGGTQTAAPAPCNSHPRAQRRLPRAKWTHDAVLHAETQLVFEVWPPKDEADYQEFLNSYMEYFEVSTEDELYESYTKEELEELYYREKALDKVIEKAKVTEEEAAEEIEEEE